MDGTSLRATEEGTRYWRPSSNASESIAGNPRLQRSLVTFVALGTKDGTVRATEWVRVEGPEVRAGRWIYFGQATTKRIVIDGQQVPLIVPSGVDPALPPVRIARTADRTARLKGMPDAPATLSIRYQRKVPFYPPRIHAWNPLT